MAVSANGTVTWSPVTLSTNKGSVVPSSRFIGYGGTTGDGSGGAVTISYYLNTAAANTSNQNIHYVLTELGIYVGNTGVAYKGVLYVNSSNLLWSPEGSSDAIPKYLWADSLLDDGVSTTISYRDVVYLGHEITATDAVFQLVVTTNTNTKEYKTWVRGYKFYGFPIIKRDSFWI